MIIMRHDIDYEIKMPEGVTAEVSAEVVTITGPLGTVKKKVPSQKLSISASDGVVYIAAKNPTQREKKLANTYRAHVIHMIVGVVEGHEYKLKICSGHFPIKAEIKGNVLEVKNFLGENNPRLLELKEGADVKIDGEIITVKSPDKEKAGQVAADIEHVTRVTNKDRRIFQDGIYIIEKSKTRPIPMEQ